MALALPNDWRVPLIRGVYYASLPNLTDEALFAKAISEFRKAAVLNPRSPVPPFLIGDIQSKEALFSPKSVASSVGKRIESLKAVPSYTTSIRIDPSFTIAYFNRAESFLEAGEDVPSIRDFTTVISREPDNAMAFADRGNAYVDNHNYYQAISDFSSAIRMRDWGDSTLYEKRADAYVAASDDRAAVDDYSDGIALTLLRQLILIPTAEFRALYPEYDSLNETAFLRVFHQRFAPDTNEEDFKNTMAYPSKWYDSFQLESSYEKRGDAYLRLNKYAAAIADFNRIYRGFPKIGDTIERWRDIGGYSLDVKTSRISGGAPSLWIKKPEKAGGFIVMNFLINCDARQIQQASAHIYDKEGAAKSSDGAGLWSGVIPDTLGERLWDGVCTQSQ